ncbi:DEAD/DEAH box helicase [Desulfovibrio aminophilus]|nr:DEAD/DEAH box helicase [Desulfovibrio aminophilus]MCM0755431.1 DEAD/DEAH box helicase [Desulfovibrio aminophilus]
MNPVLEYVTALLDSPRLGAQVVHHRLLPGREAVFAEPARPWGASVRGLLEARGVERLYSHQAQAVNLARAGRNVVVATPTASGKTLCYNLPVIEEALRNPDSKALYLFPLKALAQDQLRAFEELVEPLGERAPSAAIYDGDTSPYRRKKLRQSPPNVLLTNPEMVHLSLLPHHGTWAELFAGLSFVVVDEVHTYRGVLGSHMACLFRRLLRVCALYGSTPTFIFCSATVGNPEELCTQLTGLPVEAVTESGASQGGRHMVFLNPADGPAQAAILLLQAALARNLRTIVYCQSRKLTELVALWASERSGPYRERISAYRAGFLPEERREIEARMSSGELLAVISTSALELGIDIGGLDLCILVGYPGTVMATLQRGGRVGRSLRDSAVALVAGEDALDQYFMRHPEDFFARPPECAVLNPHNPVILDRHLGCAAAELSLRLGEPYLAEEPVRARVDHLLAEGGLFHTEDGREIVAGRKRPHRDLDLRGAGRSLHIEDREGREIGTIDAFRAFRETHPGAVYLHRGQSYVVADMDLETNRVLAEPRRVAYYTRVRGHKSTEILEVYERGAAFGARVNFGRLRVTEEITGYEKRAVRGGKLLGMAPLDFPPLVFETEGLWFEISDEIRRAAEQGYLHFMGGIHAVEHAAIGILPLLVLADRNDLGGISTPFHPQVGSAAVFIYDGLPGGAGLTREAFGKAAALVSATLRAVEECPCETGCPSCVHSPKCGSGNRPIDKDAARFVLRSIREGRPPEIAAQEETPMPQTPQSQQPLLLRKAAPRNFAVLDVETRHAADEVGGWNRADKMGVSIAVVWDSAREEFRDFPQEEVPAMAEFLRGFDLVVGFNVRRFDYSVLQGVTPFPFHSLPTLDMLEKVHQRLGYRLKLDNLAQATLGAGKSADGLMALKWWKEGRLDLITEYCRQDVAVTRDLYLHGRDNGFVLFQNKARQKVRLPVEW